MAHVVGIDEAAAAQLDTLASVVYPGEVDVEGGLDDAKDDGDDVDAAVLGVEPADEPVDAVEGAVGAESEEVERIDDGGDGGLSEEEKLREDADGLEDLGQDPEPLRSPVSTTRKIRTRSRPTLTCMKPQLLSKIIMTNGDKAREPPKTIAPSFQAISLSRERGYSHCMTPRM